MSANNALEKIESADLQVKRPKLVTVMSPTDLAKVFVQSGLFKDTKDVAQATVKILMGQELGISPMASMTNIHIINGKCQIGYAIVGAVIQKHPDYSYKVLKQTKTECEIEFFYRGEPLGPSVGVDIDEAKRRGVQNLDKIPDIMLFARCLTKGARMYCAEVFGGIAVYDEGELPEERPTLPQRGVSAILSQAESFHPEEAEHFPDEELEQAEERIGKAPENAVDPETGEIIQGGLL